MVVIACQLNSPHRQVALFACLALTLSRDLASGLKVWWFLPLPHWLVAGSDQAAMAQVSVWVTLLNPRGAPGLRPRARAKPSATS